MKKVKTPKKGVLEGNDKGKKGISEKGITGRESISKSILPLENN